MHWSEKGILPTYKLLEGQPGDTTHPKVLGAITHWERKDHGDLFSITLPDGASIWGGNVGPVDHRDTNDQTLEEQMEEIKEAMANRPKTIEEAKAKLIAYIVKQRMNT
jgi:hypothetical protein